MADDQIKNEEGDHDEYRGPERRSGIERRVNPDPRKELRFEPSKQDRRQKARIGTAAQHSHPAKRARRHPG